MFGNPNISKIWVTLGASLTTAASSNLSNSWDKFDNLGISKIWVTINASLIVLAQNPSNPLRMPSKPSINEMIVYYEGWLTK